jgi:hypothetical protein
MLNLNQETLAAVVEKAAHDAADHPRWLTAIGRAILELDSNPYIERNDHGGLIIGSPSGECYAANGVCQCRAFEFKIPCWHRAAARLVRLHDEREAAAAYTQAADAGAFGPAFVLNLPDDDRVEQSNRLARKIAAARATAQINELFA